MGQLGHKPQEAELEAEGAAVEVRKINLTLRAQSPNLMDRKVHNVLPTDLGTPISRAPVTGATSPTNQTKAESQVLVLRVVAGSLGLLHVTTLRTTTRRRTTGSLGGRDYLLASNI